MISLGSKPFCLVPLFLLPTLVLAQSVPRVSPADAGMRAEHLQNIEREIKLALDDGQFAGCVVAIGRRGKLVLLEAYGDRQVKPTRLPMQTDTVFDMASLTKPVATATSVMRLLEQGKLRLGDLAKDHLPDLSGEGTEAITIEHLLTHQAGYVPDNSIRDYEDGIHRSWERLLALPVEAPPGTRFKYSDVGFEMLGLIVERIDGRSLNRFASEEIFTPLGMKDTGYLPDESRRARAAATEQREGQWMVGEVHDPRAWRLGGVAGHAGLFSTAQDMAIYASALLGGGKGHGVRILGPPTVKEMTRARDVAGHFRTAGWDARSAYSSNRSELFSSHAFGHGGFTGTAMWIDPGLDLFVIFLSNRLHPDGKGSVNSLAARIGTIAAAAID